uniref:Polyprotein n=1 Tax=Steinernema glaseri TaxID=37863 RepID=A0A1I7Y9H9_9BILA
MSADNAPAKRAPGEIIFDPNHEMYWAPAMCRLVHYRHGAIVAGFVEVGLLSMVVATIISKLCRLCIHYDNSMSRLLALGERHHERRLCHVASLCLVWRVHNHRHHDHWHLPREAVLLRPGTHVPAV